MVIATSDSTGTLVSLNNKNNGLKRANSLELLQQAHADRQVEFVATDLYLPCDDIDIDDDGYDNDDMLSEYYSHDDYWGSGSDSTSYSSSSSLSTITTTTTTLPRERLYLPASALNNNNDDDKVDIVESCFKCLPVVLEAVDELFLGHDSNNILSSKSSSSSSPQYYYDASQTSQRLLYVAQQEVAHVTASDCDVLVSDKATTCHILALRSTATTTTTKTASFSSIHEPLMTMAHIDDVHYEDCLRNMFQQHVDYHRVGAFSSRIELDVHILGGYNDEHSRALSNWLIRTLARLATEFRSTITATTLRTCAISGLNDNGHGAPIGRGLAMHTRTGRVSLVTCHANVTGPDRLLRSLRLWNYETIPSSTTTSSSYPRRVLSVIHRPHNKGIVEVSPFFFQAFPKLDVLLRLSDAKLLQLCSTSPHVEDADFCPRLRESLRYLRTTECTDVFGSQLDRPRFFVRRTAAAGSNAKNAWTLMK